MASTRVDSVLHHLQLLQKNLEKGDSYETGFCHLREDFETLKLNLLFLKTFLLCARNWSNDQLKVRLRSFLSKIEATVNRPGTNIRSLYLRSIDALNLKGVVTSLKPVVSNLRENIKSFKREIINTYINLSSCSSSDPSSCLRDSELVDFIDSVLQNLVDLLSRRYFESVEDYNSALHAHIEALEDKLTFLKNFIGFAKFLGVGGRELEDLLAHIQVVALNAACLSYKCLFYKEDEEMHDPKVCFIIRELLKKINPVDLQVYETYVKVLEAPKSPESLLTAQTDMQILQDFNDSLTSSLWELLWCTTSFTVCVKDQMKILYEGLRFLRSVLNAPQKNMDELNDKIVAVISEAGIVIFWLFLNGVKEVEVDSLVVGESADCCAMLVTTNNNVKLIVAQVSGSSISGSLPHYDGFRGQEVRKTTRFKPSRGRVPITYDIVVGLEKEAEKVIDRLKGGSEQLEIVPIVGMAGLGKTTLAKKVYNDASVQLDFHIFLWCSVSQELNFKNLLVRILSSVYNEELKHQDEDTLVQELKKILWGKKYLLVLDDVWDIRVWHDLKYLFPNDKSKSRILLTSRESYVASGVKFVGEPHRLRLFTKEESWELLEKKVFGEAGCPQQLRMLGKEIATKCMGLPLTIVIIAGILSTIEDDAWSEVAESLPSTIVYTTDQCKNTLELSYMNLPHHDLRRCLLYFGAFCEDQEIETAKLKRLWIAEGFVSAEGLVLDTKPEAADTNPDTKRKRTEDLAEKYMMDLIGRNLVMVAKQRHIGGVQTCRIHGLLHEFCKDKAKEENCLQVLHGYSELSTFNEHPDLKRLSIWSKVEHFKKSRLFCPQLRSLLLFNQIEKSDSFMADMSFVFCIYKKIRVLDLEQIFLPHKVFPREVEALAELRYLGVQGAMRSIPPSIDKLSNLETFVVIAESGTVSLPDTIWNMTELRHLHVVGWNVTCSLPSENLETTSGLGNLDTFSTLMLSLDDRVKNVMTKIRSVRQLKIQLSATECSTGYCNISDLEILETLEVLAESWPLNPVEFSFPQNLKELVLGGLYLPWSEISVIEKLPKLEVLILLGESFVGERWELTPGGFRELRCLSLENLDVVEWEAATGGDDAWEDATDADDAWEDATDSDDAWEDATDSHDALPCLEKLRFTGVLELEKVPSCLGKILCLEEIEVRDCNDSLKALVHKIGEELEDWGKKDLKIID